MFLRCIVVVFAVVAISMVPISPDVPEVNL